MIGTSKAVRALIELLTRKSASPADRQPPRDRRAGAIQGRRGRAAAAGSLKARGRPCGPPRSMRWSRSSRPGDADARTEGPVRRTPAVRAEVRRAVRAADRSGRRRSGTARSPPSRRSKDREAIPASADRGRAPDSRFEAATALAAMPDLRALQVYLRGLADKNTELRRASATAIANIRDQAAPVLDQLAQRNELSPAIAARAAHHLRRPERRSPPGGSSGRSRSPRTAGSRRSKPIDLSASYEGAGGRRVTWRTVERPTRGPGGPRPHLSATTTTSPPTAMPRSRAPRTGRPRWPSARTTR